MSNETRSKEAYESSVAELNAVLASLSATQEQKDRAQQALTKLAAEYGSDVVASVAGRTQLLNSLVGELRAVIAAVELNPFGNVVDKFNALVTTAKSVLDDDARA